MKNGVKLLIGLVAFTLALGSCSVEKRLHNKGYNVQWYSKETTVKEKKANKEDRLAIDSVKTKKDLTKQEVVLTEIASTTVENEVNKQASTAYTYANDEASTDNSVASVAGKSTNKPYYNQTTEIAKNNSVEKQEMTKKQEKSNAATRGGGSAGGGGMLVLMIILCLFPFLNLISVYLHDGSIGMNFWVTLLLDFLAIVGVIFGFLVIFDVVSL
jgi:hypothetical protein